MLCQPVLHQRRHFTRQTQHNPARAAGPRSLTNAIFYGADIDTGRITIGGIEETFLGDYGAEASLRLKVKAGLETRYTLNVGSIAATLPYDFKVAATGVSTAAGNYDFTNSFTVKNTGSFEAAAPSL